MMRTTVTIDDELLAKAKRYSGVDETGDVIRLAVQRLIEWEASRRLAALGGSNPDFTPAPRKRSLAA